MQLTKENILSELCRLLEIFIKSLELYMLVIIHVYKHSKIIIYLTVSYVILADKLS